MKPVRTPLGTLGPADLQAAKRRLADITVNAERGAADNRGPGWNPVIELLQDGWDGFDQEIQRRA